MEAKDLMDGDWVFIKQLQHPTKVTNIYSNSVYTESVFQLSIDEIEPIPITQEILEKKKMGLWLINTFILIQIMNIPTKKRK